MAISKITNLYEVNKIDYKTVVDELYKNFLTPEEIREIEINLLEDKWEYLDNFLEEYNEDVIFYAEDYVEDERQDEFVNYMLSKY